MLFLKYQRKFPAMRLLLLLLLTVAALRPAHCQARLKAEVVLIPGSGSSGAKIHIANLNWGTKILGERYFGGHLDALAEKGIPARVCPREEDEDRRPIEERAEDCARMLTADAACPKGSLRSVILVGHSMGGLVARLLARDPRVKECIHSVITISTPNRGTPIADLAIERGARGGGKLDLLGRFVQLIRYQPDYLRYLPQLRIQRHGQAAELFRAQDSSDEPGVRYFSITNSISHTLMVPLEYGRALIVDELKKRRLEDPTYGTDNDGIVPTFSMPHGTVIGNLDVHHWATACLDPVRFTPECKRTQKLLLPVIERLYGEITHSQTGAAVTQSSR